MSQIQELVDKLERKILKNKPWQLPGTTIARCLSPKEGDGYIWTVGAGLMAYPLQWFHHKNLHIALKKAIKGYKS